MHKVILNMGFFDFIFGSPSKTEMDENGYKRFKDSKIPVHRWVAEKKIGRKLKPGEVVHHKNRIKTDNSPDNLHVFRNQKEHDRIHKIDAAKHGKKSQLSRFLQKEKKELLGSILRNEEHILTFNFYFFHHDAID